MPFCVFQDASYDKDGIICEVSYLRSCSELRLLLFSSLSLEGARPDCSPVGNVAEDSSHEQG